MVVPSSAAICGSSGSHTRRLAALANAARASRAMARVGIASTWARPPRSSISSAIGYGYGAGAFLSSGGAHRMAAMHPRAQAPWSPFKWDGLLADPALAVAAMASEVEMEVVAVIDV